MSKVTFLRAQNSKQKLNSITDTLEKLLLDKKRALVVVPNEEALSFLDDHLWAYKPEAFLPHAIAKGPSKAPIVLSLTPDNFNQAEACLNLLPTPLPPQAAEKFPQVFELLDETSPEKKALSRLKEEAWANA